MEICPHFSECCKDCTNSACTVFDRGKGHFCRSGTPLMHVHTTWKRARNPLATLSKLTWELNHTWFFCVHCALLKNKHQTKLIIALSHIHTHAHTHTPTHTHACTHTLTKNLEAAVAKDLSSRQSRNTSARRSYPGTPGGLEAQSGLTVGPAGKAQCQGGKMKPCRPHLHWSKPHQWGK